MVVRFQQPVVLSGDLDDADAVEAFQPLVGHLELQDGTVPQPAREDEPPRPASFIVAKARRPCQLHDPH